VLLNFKEARIGRSGWSVSNAKSAGDKIQNSLDSGCGDKD